MENDFGNVGALRDGKEISCFYGNQAVSCGIIRKIFFPGF
jgi:hypothetical protein